MHLKTISLPKLNNLTPSLESTTLKLMEESGELAQAIGKLRGMSGETPNKEWLQSAAKELFDVAQTAISMMFVLEDQYGINIEEARDTHIKKLISKGYIK